MRFDLDLIVYGILLILLIVAGCVVVVRVRRWRDEQGAPLSVEEQITNFQALVERGELDPKEFERIKARLLEGQAAESPPTADTGIQAARNQESGIRSQESGGNQETGIRSQESRGKPEL